MLRLIQNILQVQLSFKIKTDLDSVVIPGEQSKAISPNISIALFCGESPYK